MQRLILNSIKDLSVNYKYLRLGLILTVFIVLSISVFLNLGNWLVVRDELPENLDYIYIFAGDALFNRDRYGVSLLEKYPKAIIILDTAWYSNQITTNKWAKDVIPKLDISKIKFIGPSNSTLEELQNLKLIFEKKTNHNKKKLSIGFVSSPYHIRRIKLISYTLRLAKVVDSYLLPFEKESAKYYRFDSKRWWESKGNRSIIGMEYVKMGHMIFK